MNATLSPADVKRKDAWVLDNENREEEEGILISKASRNTPPDVENNVKKRKKKKNRFKPPNDKEITYSGTIIQNHNVIELIDIQPSPRSLPDIPETAISLLQIHLPEERRYEALHFPKEKTPVEVIYTKDQGTEMQVTYTEEEATQTEKPRPLPGIPETANSLQQQHKTSLGKKTSPIVLCSRGIIMVAAIVLISTSEEISKAKPCDLEKALTSISVNYNFPCKHHAIKEKTANLRNWGISLWILNFIYFILILIYLLLPQLRKLLRPESLMPNILKGALVFLFACNAFIFSITMVKSYNDVRKTKAEKSDINFDQIKATMFDSLEKTYTSDNISSNDAVSNSWNTFFIEYDCCGINQVQGTTNDFDSTPWCTTSGSCQATSSQIPKTCCNGVSKDDYGSALSNCHSSVSPGTYKSNCINAIKRLSVTQNEEYKISLLQVSLLIIGTLEIAEAFLVLVLTIEFVFFK